PHREDPLILERVPLTRRELLHRSVALLVAAPPALRLAAAHEATVQHFVSRPDLLPPRLTVLHDAPGGAPGLAFLAPSSGPGQRGAMIVDNAGELVWFHPVANKAVTDFKVQHLHGKPVLTWWEGKSNHGLGDGEWVVLDAAYKELARFSTVRGLHGDLHEFGMSPQRAARA